MSINYIILIIFLNKKIKLRYHTMNRECIVEIVYIVHYKWIYLYCTNRTRKGKKSIIRKNLYNYKKISIIERN